MSLAGAIALSLAAGIGFVWHTSLADLAEWGFLGERRRWFGSAGSAGSGALPRPGISVTLLGAGSGVGCKVLISLGFDEAGFVWYCLFCWSC